MTFLSKVKDRMLREPVLGFGLIGLFVAAYAPELVDTAPEQAFVAGVVLYLQRIFSTPTKTAEENVEAAKYVGAVEQQAGIPPAAPPPPAVG